METLKELISRILDIEEDILNIDSSPDNIQSWDSFNGLMMVSELENLFNVKFTSEEIISITSFGDIINALKKKGIVEGIDG